MSNKMTLEQAASLLGVSRQKLAKMMQKGLVPIGYAYSPEETGLKEWTYLIYRKKVEKYIE